jgi:autotransporter-associated beta strand protein
MALNSAGNVRISYSDYYDYGVRALKFATSNDGGSSWSVGTVMTGRDVGTMSLALDAAGNPRIAYYDSLAKDLRYAVPNNGGGPWSTSIVDNSGSVGEYCSLALDASGNPRISYYDATNGHLKFAFSSDLGASWRAVTVDEGANVGGGTSLRLNALGNPRISYGQGDSFTEAPVKFAYATMNDCTWSTNTGGEWTNPDNWSNYVVPNVPGAVARFPNNGAANQVVTISAAVRTGSVVFDSGTGRYTISSTAQGRLRLASADEATAQITVAAGQHRVDADITLDNDVSVAVPRMQDSLEISGNIVNGANGAAGLAKTGDGVLILSGDNSFDGGIIVSAGILNIASAGALPPGRSLTIGSSGTVVLATGLSMSLASGENLTTVPEPASLTLLGVAAVGLLIRARRPQGQKGGGFARGNWSRRPE